MVSYQPLLHRTAERELNGLRPKERVSLTDTIKNVCKQESPTSHPKAKQLEGQDQMFRIRVGDVRAVLQLDKPNVLVLKVGKRKSVYDDVDEIHERAAPA